MHEFILCIATNKQIQTLKQCLNEKTNTLYLSIKMKFADKISVHTKQKQ